MTNDFAGIKISNLSSISSLSDNDLFICSEKSDANSYFSKNISFRDLFYNVLKEIQNQTFTVKFYGYTGDCLKTQTVKYACDSTPPEVPSEIEGKSFIGWNRPYTNVIANIDVSAKYSEKYSYGEIFYNSNFPE